VYFWSGDHKRAEQIGCIFDLVVDVVVVVVVVVVVAVVDMSAG